MSGITTNIATCITNITACIGTVLILKSVCHPEPIKAVTCITGFVFFKWMICGSPLLSYRIVRKLTISKKTKRKNRDTQLGNETWLNNPMQIHEIDHAPLEENAIQIGDKMEQMVNGILTGTNQQINVEIPSRNESLTDGEIPPENEPRTDGEIPPEDEPQEESEISIEIETIAENEIPPENEPQAESETLTESETSLDNELQTGVETPSNGETQIYGGMIQDGALACPTESQKFSEPIACTMRDAHDIYLSETYNATASALNAIAEFESYSLQHNFAVKISNMRGKFDIEYVFDNSRSFSTMRRDKYENPNSNLYKKLHDSALKTTIKNMIREYNANGLADKYRIDGGYIRRIEINHTKMSLSFLIHNRGLFSHMSKNYNSRHYDEYYMTNRIAKYSCYARERLYTQRYPGHPRVTTRFAETYDVRNIRTTLAEIIGGEHMNRTDIEMFHIDTSRTLFLGTDNTISFDLFDHIYRRDEYYGDQSRSPSEYGHHLKFIGLSLPVDHIYIVIQIVLGRYIVDVSNSEFRACSHIAGGFFSYFSKASNHRLLSDTGFRTLNEVFDFNTKQEAIDRYSYLAMKCDTTLFFTEDSLPYANNNYEDVTDSIPSKAFECIVRTLAKHNALPNL